MTDESLAAFHVADILAGAPHHTGPHLDSLVDSFRQTREEGVAIVLGITGMFEAIRRRYVTMEVGTDYELGYWTGFGDAKHETFNETLAALAVPSPGPATEGGNG